MKNLLYVGRVAWDDRFCRLALFWLIFLTVTSGDGVSAVILAFSSFLGIAAAVAFAGGGKQGLAMRAEWVYSIWFCAVFLGLLYGVTLVLG